MTANEMTLPVSRNAGHLNGMRMKLLQAELGLSVTGCGKLSEIRRWKHCFMRISTSHFREVCIHHDSGPLGAAAIDRTA